jgi:hypothetical protein
MSFVRRFSCIVDDEEEGRVRAVAPDVHRDFREAAIVAEGRLRSAGRVRTRPDAFELFARSLDPRDWVVLEVTGNASELLVRRRPLQLQNCESRALDFFSRDVSSVDGEMSYDDLAMQRDRPDAYDELDKVKIGVGLARVQLARVRRSATLAMHRAGEVFVVGFRARLRRRRGDIRGRILGGIVVLALVRWMLPT